MTLNSHIVGKRYRGTPHLIEADRSMFYALSVGDTNPAYLDLSRSGGLMAPPVYAAVYAHEPIAEALRDPAVGVHYPSIVHYAQSFTWNRPARPGDEIITDGRIIEASNFENGGIVTIETVSRNQQGDVVTAGQWSFFDRSAKSIGAGPAPRHPEINETTVWRDAFSIPSYQSHVYAEASGDHNAIHVDADEAKKRGLPGIILHGFCTMACCQKVVVNRLCDGDPERLSSLFLQFAKPVFPNDRLNLEGFELGDKVFGMRVKNSQGQSVLRHVKGALR